MLSCLFVNGQDFESWKKAISTQFNEIPIAAREKSILVTFDRNKNTGEPFACLKFTYYLVNLNGPGHSEPFKLFFDSQSKIPKVKLNNKKLSKITESRYSNFSNSIFHSDIWQKSFNINFKKSQQESKLEYTLQIKDLRYLGQLFFNDRFAVKDFSLEIQAPEWLSLEIVDFNFEQQVKVEKEVEVNSKNSKTHYYYKANNLRPWVNLTNLEGPSYIYPHLLLISNAYLNKEDRWQKQFRSVDDLYSWYHKLIITNDNEPETLNNQLSELVSPSSSKLENAIEIYEWVRDNIKYIAFENGLAGYQPESCQKVYGNKYGDCKGMTNLLIQMLRKSNFDARYTWLGTRFLTYDYQYPSLVVDNHMICALFFEDDTIFLDPTDKLASFGHNSSLIEGRQVMIEDGESYIITNIPKVNPEQNSRKIEVDFEAVNLENNTLKGTFNLSLNGDCKYDLENFDVTKAEGKSALISNYVFNNEASCELIALEAGKIQDKEFSCTAKLKCTHLMSNFSNEIYLQVNPLENNSEILIDELRILNYLFERKQLDDIRIQWQIPEGYQVKYLPENITLSNSFIKVTLSFEVKEKIIYFDKKVIYKQQSIPPTEFKSWNKIINIIKKAEEDRIILDKY